MQLLAAGWFALAPLIATHEKCREDLRRHWMGGPAATVRDDLQERGIDPTLVSLALRFTAVLRFAEHPQAHRQALPAIEERARVLAVLATKLEAILSDLHELTTAPPEESPPPEPKVTYESENMTRLRQAITDVLPELRVKRRPAVPSFVMSPGALFDWLTSQDGLSLEIADVVKILNAHPDDFDKLRQRRNEDPCDLGNVARWVWQQRERHQQRHALPT